MPFLSFSEALREKCCATIWSLTQTLSSVAYCLLSSLCCSLTQPLVSHQTGFGFFWWSLNIEDPDLNDDSKLEKAGVETDPNNNARDRNMKLQWAPLKFMLEVIAKVNNSKQVYGREHWDDKARHTSWTLLPGGVIEPAGAIFT